VQCGAHTTDGMAYLAGFCFLSTNTWRHSEVFLSVDFLSRTTRLRGRCGKRRRAGVLLRVVYAKVYKMASPLYSAPII
jgi:hypothetical protein